MCEIDEFSDAKFGERPCSIEREQLAKPAAYAALAGILGRQGDIESL